jgi:dynein heavy chain, axonemal
VSSAAGKLCDWALALSEYQIVNKNIIPKKAKAAEMDAILKENMTILNKTLAEVKEVKDKVAELEATANNLLNEKERLEKQMARDTARMGRAEKLVVLLADEGIRWAETVAQLEIEIQDLVGNVFLSCACISYFGAFTGVYRKMLTDKWTSMAKEMEIHCSD